MKLWEPQTYGNTREILSTIIGKVSVDFPCFPPIKGLLYVHSSRPAKEDIDNSLKKYNPGVPECFEGDDDVGNEIHEGEYGVMEQEKIGWDGTKEN